MTRLCELPEHLDRNLMIFDLRGLNMTVVAVGKCTWYDYDMKFT